MSKQGRILIVDDEEKWGKELAETLRRNDFSADAVENVTQALERLSNTMYHIVVLDIRLPSSSEGIGLLEELDRRGLKEATKVIMHSGYGTLEQMRLSFKDYDVADFVPKTNSETFLKSVQQVFAQKVKINPALNIKWPVNSRVEQIVSNLIVNGKRVGRNSTLRRQLIEELDDLFCRLFYEAEMVLVQPLTPTGRSGAGVVLIQPFFRNTGRAEDVIVKFGDVNMIKKEYYNFQQYVRRFLRGGRSTAVYDQRYTPHLGGIVYSFLGANKDQLVDFAEFYRKMDISKIIDAMNHLFRDTCGNWYDNRSQVQPLDLAADYRRLFQYSPRKLELILANQLPSVHVEEKLVFTSLNSTRKFTNPLLAMAGLSLTRYTTSCITHGDFNPHNLFVDPSGFTWLIDFQATEPSHILRDFAMLDSAIRFQLLTEATLEERLQMEDTLCKVEHFSQLQQIATGFTEGNQSLAKACTAIIHLRRLAGFVAQNSHDDISEYYLALFYNALNTLRFSSLETVQHEHALLCASLLANRLGLAK